MSVRVVYNMDECAHAAPATVCLNGIKKKSVVASVFTTVIREDIVLFFYLMMKDEDVL